MISSRRKAACSPVRRHALQVAQLIGPYYQLTRKIAGKTITRRLTGDEAARYAEWIANQRELRRLVTEMEAISRQAAELILQQDTTNHHKTPGDEPA